ncbi:MAG: Hsp20/alpha crystallin family protein [Planctomycetota bacterium]
MQGRSPHCDSALATDVNQEKINAECKDGVLTVTLPKAAKARTIKVKVKG